MAHCAYIFLDEGGNFDFSPGGTRYFILTGITTVRPFRIHAPLEEYKHDCLEFGLDLDHFHCTENNRHVRRRVFELIERHLGQLCIDSIIVEKRKTGAAIRTDQRFYPEMLGYLLRLVLEKGKKADEVIIITDTIPHRKKRQAIEKATRMTLKDMLPGDCPYRILHHASKSHFSLQVTDYCNWAIFRKWEQGDREYYDQIKPAIRSEFDIFQAGTKYYY